VKKSINESESDYIEPMKNRKYFSSYSQALKKMNLMAREFNALYENVEGTSLFNEQKKKYILKVPKAKPTADETPAPAAAPPVPAPDPVPAPAPEPVPAPEESMPPMGDDTAMPPMGDEGSLPPPSDDEGMPPMSPGEDEGMPPMGDDEDVDVDVDVEPKEKKVSDLKRIQILVGKLSQKIRSYEESKELSAKDVKYIINSILSAIDVDVLSEKDIEQIIAKLDKSEGDDEDVDVDVDVEEEEPMEPEEMEEPEGEMEEGYDTLGHAFGDYLGAAYANTAMRKMEGQEIEEEDDDDYEDEYHRERRKGRKHLINPPQFTHGTYTESSVDKVLSKYFTISESEEKDIQRKQQERTQKQYKDTKAQVIRLSESIDQIEAATEYIKEYPRAKLFGISNKGNLIFKQGISEVKITKSGDIL
jgi:hypothetical protein